MDTAGVQRAILVPPSWEGDRNDLVLDAVARYPDRFAAMGRVPLTVAPSVTRSAAARLRAWRDRPGMLGVRVTLHRDPWRAAFQSGDLDWFWRAVDDAGLPVMVYAPGLSDRLGAVAQRYSGLRLVVDHMALPVGLAGPQAFAGLPELLALARFPHLAVKASALPCHSRQGFPFADVHEPLRQVLDAFGPHRLFWGSDWTRLPCTYQENVKLFTEAVPFLSGADLRAVMGEALLAWLKW